MLLNFFDKERMIFNMAEQRTETVVRIKKGNVFTRIRNWWKYDLDQDTRDWLKITGIWTVNGTLWGSLITAGGLKRKMKKEIRKAEAAGYITGAMDAYRDMAMQPGSKVYMQHNHQNNTKRV